MVSTGRQIKAGRGALDWSRAELADRAGVHPQAVSYWERRERIHERQNRPDGALEKMTEALKAGGIELTSKPPSVVLEECCCG